MTMNNVVLLPFLVILFLYNDVVAEPEADASIIIKQYIVEKAHRKVKSLHEECKHTSECEYRTECRDNVCVCTAEYREVDGKCIEKIPLNSVCFSCDEDPGCADPQSECYEDVCQCKQGYAEQNGVCVEELEETGQIKGSCNPETGSCASDNSQCNAGICECQIFYINAGPFCLPEKNAEESCEYNQQCPDEMVCDCTNYTCGCKKGFVLSPDGTCVTSSFKGGYCEYSVQCTGTHTICEDSVCICETSYGQSKENPVNCVAKKTTIRYGPVSIDNDTLPYNEDYSDVNSDAYINVAKPVIDFMISSYVDRLLAHGLEVTLTEVVSLEEGDSGGSDLTLDFTLYNPDYDRPTRHRRFAPVDELHYDTSFQQNDQIVSRTGLVLQQMDVEASQRAGDVRAASKLNELCDDSSHCDVTGASCIQGACVCELESCMDGLY